MRRERQVELLQRVADSGSHFVGLHVAHSMVNPASAYTDPVRFAEEQRVLFRTGPTLLGLSCEMAEAGDYLTGIVGGVPVMAVRQPDGSLNAMVVWMPLVDVDEALGALEIVPGSHRWGLLPSEQDEWYRKVAEADRFPYQSVEVAAGDALFFSAFLLHRSGNNVTDAIRWSCHFRYNDLSEATFIARHYPHPYIYKAQQELITNNFPAPEQLQTVFSAAEKTQATAT